MWQVNRITTALFDGFFAVMESWPGWASLLVLSALTGVIALLAYKYTSNQRAIGKVHDDIRAALLAAKLFKDDIRVTLRAQGKLFTAATKLFLLSLQPLAVMIIPMALLLAQMAPRYEWQPLRVGDEVTLYADLATQDARNTPPIELASGPGVELLEGPITFYGAKFKDFPEVHRVYGRLRVVQNGRLNVTLRSGNVAVAKELMVSDRPHSRMSPIRAGASFWDQLLFAVEKPAAAGEPIQKVWIEPVRPGVMSLFGLKLHWVIWWLILSMIIALLVKPFLKVQLW